MDGDEELRQQAIRRIRAKQSFTIHLTVYVVVNLLLLTIWLFTDRGYFWPIWPLVGWGIGLFFHGFGVFRMADISESRIQSEMDRLRR